MHLFDHSIRANFLLARPDADDAALDAARIGDVVRALLSPAPLVPQSRGHPGGDSLCYLEMLEPIALNALSSKSGGGL
jgi:hypothetical protein